MAFALLQLRTWLSSVLPDRDDDAGRRLVEYALLLALIAIVCVVAVTVLGEHHERGLSSGAAAPRLVDADQA